MVKILLYIGKKYLFCLSNRSSTLIEQIIEWLPYSLFHAIIIDKLCTIWGAGFGSYSVKLANQSSFIHLERAVKKLLIEKEWVTYFLAYYLIGLRRNQAHSIFFNLFYNIRRIYYMNPEYMCNIVSFLPRDFLPPDTVFIQTSNLLHARIQGLKINKIYLNTMRIVLKKVR